MRTLRTSPGAAGVGHDRSSVDLALDDPSDRLIWINA
jgi:hypothetical protein